MLTELLSIAFGILVCLMLSAFFSSSEMAYSGANIMRLEKLKDEGDKKARKALKITQDFDRVLSAILIGNNLVNIACSSLGSVFIIKLLNSDRFTWISTIVITVLVIIFGETIPKITAKRNATAKSIEYAQSLSLLINIFSPISFVVVKAVNFILKPFGKAEEDEEEEAEESVEELQSIIETAEEEGVLDTEDSELIQNAIDFSEISASEVMTARVDVDAIEIDDSWEEILNLVNQTPYSRIPVYKDTIDNIVGILHLNVFLKKTLETSEPFDLNEILLEPCYVYKTMKLPSVLNQLKAAKQHLAIVKDEYGGTLGVISMEDVLEQIVGEIWDESDEIENDIVIKNDSEFELDGDLSISEFLETIGVSEEEFEAESDTVGGWVVETLDHFPEENESFAFMDFTVTVLKKEDFRVEKILIKKNNQSESKLEDTVS